MIKIFSLKLLLFSFLLNIYMFSQSENRSFSVSTGIGLISSSKIFPNPKSSDLIQRNKSYEIANVLSPSIELKYHFNSELSIGLSAEYSSKMIKGNFVTALSGNQLVDLESEDGYTFIPIEISIFQKLPFSTKYFNFNIGGGLGYYFAFFKRNFGNAVVKTVESSPVFGIQVSTSFEYKLFDYIKIFLQTKYRAPEIKVKSKYDKNEIVYKNRTITILQDTFDSKISVNGIVLTIGLSINFN